MELEKLNNEVLRKIGRNVMLFQQMEHILKVLLANGSYSGYISELNTILEDRNSTIRTQTMGQVVKQFSENTFSAPKETANGPEELKEIWMSFRFTIEGDDDLYEKRKNALDSIVAERNELIHHLLPKWNMNSLESSKTIELYLDQQREKILPELENLKALAKAMQEARKELANFLASDEVIDELIKPIDLAPLRNSLIVAGLFEFAEQEARPDNWAELNKAFQFIVQKIPKVQLADDFANIKKRYGYQKLSKILLASEYFDLSEEPTKKGGLRVLYRIKPDLDFID
ncbi:MAG: hypothetical protein M0R47_01160 [Methylobacter sp.]|uniref:hypothetical protein n=1 Tax=Methylobacter sp. TaxID=2051955 RepID=UPI0025FC99CD|nr:hypothetical protein [Methylobacter sp.]MCK9619123.1 hypothetical protein [Methylobacter sp.]